MATATDDFEREYCQLENSEESVDTKSAGSALEISTLKKKVPTRTKKPLTSKQQLLRFIDKYFMLLSLAIIIPFAFLYPIGHNDGPLHPKITSSWVVTIVLFFGIGLGVKLEYLKRSCMFWQMNVFCHFVIFIYYPLVGFTIYQLTQLLPNNVISESMDALFEGIILLCTLPATTASAIVFTSNANGNEAAAAINCTMSNLLGIFITPVLIWLFMGAETAIDAGDIFFKLSLRVIAPFVLAQIIRILIGSKGRHKLKEFKPYIKKINEASLLYMVFCALSETVYHGMDAVIGEMLVFLVVIISLHCHGYIAIWCLSSLFRCCLMNKSQSLFMAFTVYDRIACIYSGVSKTIALGIPLIETIYGDNEKVGLYILPILCYHPSNLIVGSLMVEPLKKLVAKERQFISSYIGTASFTDLMHGTDYGTIPPFKIGPDSTFIFAPFTPLPDESDEYESISRN